MVSHSFMSSQQYTLERIPASAWKMSGEYKILMVYEYHVYISLAFCI